MADQVDETPDSLGAVLSDMIDDMYAGDQHRAMRARVDAILGAANPQPEPEPEPEPEPPAPAPVYPPLDPTA